MKRLIILAAFCAGAAHAEFKDGNKLLSDLNSTGSVLPAVGLGYVMGVVDAYGGITHCPPENVTAGQIRDMVRNFLENTPSIRHLPANDIVGHVVKKAWPCAETKKGTGV